MTKQGDRLHHPNTQAFKDRQSRWLHNSFFGHVGMAKQNMRAIVHAETTTREARDLAVEICQLLAELGFALKERRKLHTAVCPLCGNGIKSTDDDCQSGGPQPDGCALAMYGVRDILKAREKKQ